MKVSINQPAYLPWSGYFDRIRRSDVHIVLDSVQFEKNSLVNRNKVRVGSSPTWLTVPVKTKGRFGALPIADLEIADDRWRRKHVRTLEQQYRGAAGWSDFGPALIEVLDREWSHLEPLLAECRGLLRSTLGIATPLVRSTSLPAVGEKSDLVLGLCRELGASSYLSGPHGRDYLDMPSFAEAGIEVEFHDYVQPRYAQGTDRFIPNLSVVDMVLSVGVREARQALVMEES